MIVQLPKSVFSYDVRDFLHFMLIKFADCVPHPKKKNKNDQLNDFSEFPEAIESTWVSPPSCRGCASCRKRTPELQSLADEHTTKQLPPFFTCILHRCFHLQFARIYIYIYIYISAINNEIRRAMEGWGILCRCCDDILMAILFTGFEVYRGTFPWVTWPIYCHVYNTNMVFSVPPTVVPRRVLLEIKTIKNSLKSWHEPSPSVCHHISLRASQLLCPSPRQWPTKRGHILPSGTLPFYVAGPGIENPKLNQMIPQVFADSLSDSYLLH